MSTKKQPAPRLLRWTRFASDPHGTGPEKRSAQILSLCRGAGFGVDDMQPPSHISRWQVLKAGLSARWRHGAHASVDHAGPGLLGFRARFYQTALAAHQGTRVLLWETTYDTLLPEMAHAAGFKIIALPHNLEALVSERVFADQAYNPFADLAAEVDRLARAEAIFTIAKEERWLLEARGLEPDYLPYYPDPVLVDECGAIRRKREARADAGGAVAGPLLLLGSAFNPATARGMREQLRRLKANGLPPGGVTVAGPRSDEVLADEKVPGIQLLGGVSRERLVGLLETCTALLIHTVAGAGAVTRIPEGLLAGLPIIANPNAARDQHGVSGVHVYETAAEFEALARKAWPIPPAPSRPTAAEARFVDTLARLTAAVSAPA